MHTTQHRKALREGKMSTNNSDDPQENNQQNNEIVDHTIYEDFLVTPDTSSWPAVDEEAAVYYCDHSDHYLNNSSGSNNVVFSSSGNSSEHVHYNTDNIISNCDGNITSTTTSTRTLGHEQLPLLPEQTSPTRPNTSVCSLQDMQCNATSSECGRQKKRRSTEIHNLNERLRRQKFKRKMTALQELIPNCSKRDKASTLDDAIKYMKALQNQIQVMTASMEPVVPLQFRQPPPYMIPQFPTVLGQEQRCLDNQVLQIPSTTMMAHQMPPCLSNPGNSSAGGVSLLTADHNNPFTGSASSDHNWDHQSLFMYMNHPTTTHGVGPSSPQCTADEQQAMMIGNDDNPSSSCCTRGGLTSEIHYVATTTTDVISDQSSMGRFTASKVLPSQVVEPRDVGEDACTSQGESNEGTLQASSVVESENNLSLRRQFSDKF